MPAPSAEPDAPATTAEPPRPVSEPVVPRPTSIASAAFSPAFATTGSAVFYHSGMGPRSAIMKADTGSDGEVLRVTRVVDDRASNFHARPSPDGRLIAFDSDRDGERGVYIADAEGQGVRRVSGDGFAAVPSWSPDGRTLAFVRAEDDKPKVWNIWTVDLDTGEQKRVTSHAFGQPWGAAWFPDGRRIAYSHEDRLVIRTVDGQRRTTVNSPIRGGWVRTPAVSPDGRQVIFQVRKNGAWVLDVASGRMRKVLTDPTAEEFTWSPDGRRVAYHSRRSGKWGVRVLESAALTNHR
jgi:Tol biopolymer transport system component